MKVIWIIAGSVSLALGIIGIFVPLLPTTPFLLLAAAAYGKGSARLYNRLLNQKYVGPYIRRFRENKAIPLRAKIYAVTLLWATIGYCIIFPDLPLWVRIMLGCIAAGVTRHILSFKTLRKE
jgi:uncharacterized membrane protein YbaN (DUF454 family)